MFRVRLFNLIHRLGEDPEKISIDFTFICMLSQFFLYTDNNFFCLTTKKEAYVVIKVVFPSLIWRELIILKNETDKKKRNYTIIFAAYADASKLWWIDLVHSCNENKMRISGQRISGKLFRADKRQTTENMTNKKCTMRNSRSISLCEHFPTTGKLSWQNDV